MITLQYCDGFCHTSTWTGHRNTWVLPILKSPHVSLPTLFLYVVPEQWLWVPSFIHQTPTGHLFYIYIYMFQCYSLKSSQALLPPLSPKVCSLCLCLLCCPACRTVRIIFLNSRCMSLYTVFVFLFLTYFTLFKYKGSRFIHLNRTDSNAFLFYSWVIFHCVYVQVLYINSPSKDHRLLWWLSVKNPPEMWEIWVWSLEWEDPPDESMATHSNILAWRIHKDSEEPGGLQSMGSQRVRHDWWLSTQHSIDQRTPAVHFQTLPRKISTLSFVKVSHCSQRRFSCHAYVSVFSSLLFIRSSFSQLPVKLGPKTRQLHQCVQMLHKL